MQLNNNCFELSGKPNAHYAITLKNARIATIPKIIESSKSKIYNNNSKDLVCFIDNSLACSFIRW